MIDNLYEASFLSGVREDIKHMNKHGMMKCSGNNVKVRGPSGDIYSHALNKPGILECDVILNGSHTINVSDCGDSVSSFCNSHGDKLIEELQTMLPSLSLLKIDQLKMQYNEGNGSCFPMHFDTAVNSSADETYQPRQITVITYLNPDWQVGDGGELRVYPLPFKHVDIQPIFGRTVVFCSHSLLHRVLPAFKERYCLSLWISAQKATSLPTNMLSGLPEEFIPLLSFLSNPVNRTMIAKVIYRDEWANSIRESLDDEEGGNGAISNSLAIHFEEVEIIKSRVNSQLMALLLEHLPI